MRIKNNLSLLVMAVGNIPSMATCVSIGPVDPRCEGIPFPLKATVSCGQTISQTWYTFGDGFFSTLSDTQTIYYPGHNERVKGSFKVGFKVEFTGGAEDSSSVTGKINFIPTGDFNCFTTGCEPFATSFNGKFWDADSIIWNFGDGFSRLGSETIGHVYYARSTPYDVSVRLVSLYGCDTVLVKPAYVKVYVRPIADFNLSTHQVIYPSSPVVIFQNLSDLRGLPADSVSFKWYRNGILAGTNKQPTFAYAFTNGPNGKNSISLEIETKNGCTGKHIDYLMVYGTGPSTGIHLPDIVKRGSYEKNLLEISRELTSYHEFGIQVFNFMGQEMLQFNNVEDFPKLLLLPDGNYVIQVMLLDKEGFSSLQRAKFYVTD